MAILAGAQADPNERLNREFHSAVAQYDAGRFAEAAAKLEALLPHAPNSFEIQELLGLVYAGESQNAKALEHLQAAVRLKPDSAAARTNLAAGLVHSGKPELAEEQFRKALELEPGNYEANHDLGEFYAQSGKIAEAQPLLQAAQQTDPSSYDNGYDLAQADLVTGRLGDARQLVQALAAKKNTGELHDLRAQIEEKDGKFVAAANEYEIAAHLDPSEENLFDWGSELLLHRTYDPAIEVFQQGAQRYPKSARLSIGLGMALYWRGKYEDAIQALLTATDLNPSDPRCYLFLSKAYDYSPGHGKDMVERFRRYSELEPNDAMAQYYYAMSLWKGNAAGDAAPDLAAVEALLRRSITLDPSLAQAHFQLGVLYTDRHDYERSLPEYQDALKLDPTLADAHYKLGQYYVHSGQKSLAQEQFDIYQRLRTERQAELDKQAAEVQQFVYSEKATGSAKP